MPLSSFFPYAIAKGNIFSFGDRCQYGFILFMRPKDFSIIDKTTLANNRLSIFKISCIVVVSIFNKSVQSQVAIADLIDNIYLYHVLKIADDALSCSLVAGFGISISLV